MAIRNGSKMTKTNEKEMLEDIEFLLGQLQLMEWAQDDDEIKRLRAKYLERCVFYTGRARRDNMSTVGDKDYEI